MSSSRVPGKDRDKDDKHHDRRSSQQPRKDSSGHHRSSRDSRAAPDRGSRDQTKSKASRHEERADRKQSREDYPTETGTRGVSGDEFQSPIYGNTSQATQAIQVPSTSTAPTAGSQLVEVRPYGCEHQGCPSHGIGVFSSRAEYEQHLRAYHSNTSQSSAGESTGGSFDMRAMRHHLPGSRGNIPVIPEQLQNYAPHATLSEVVQVQNPNIFIPPTPSGTRTTTAVPAPEDTGLFGDYKVQKAPWFREGNLFSFMHHEPFNPDTGSKRSSQRNVSSVIYNEQVYSQIRRAIIMKVEKGQSYVVPISTYSGRATLKPGVNAADHAQVYTGAKPSPVKPGEYDRGLKRQSIRVLMRSDHWLDKDSRVDFNKTLIIQHNQKIKELGTVDPSDFPTLWTFWQQRWSARIQQLPTGSNNAQLQPTQQPQQQQLQYSPQSHYDQRTSQAQYGYYSSQPQQHPQTQYSQPGHGQQPQYFPQPQPTQQSYYQQQGQHGETQQYLNPGQYSLQDQYAQQQQGYHHSAHPQSTQPTPTSSQHAAYDSQASIPRSSEGTSATPSSSAGTDASRSNVSRRAYNTVEYAAYPQSGGQDPRQNPGQSGGQNRQNRQNPRQNPGQHPG